MESNKKAVKANILRILDSMTPEQLERVLWYVQKIWR
jgi:hypothetical protein